MSRRATCTFKRQQNFLNCTPKINTNVLQIFWKRSNVTVRHRDTVLLVLDVYAIHRTQFVHTYGRFFRFFKRSSLYATQHSCTMCRLRFLPEQLCGIYRQNGVETRTVATRTKPQETWRGRRWCNAMHPVYAQNEISLRRCEYVQFFLSLMKT